MTIRRLLRILMSALLLLPSVPPAAVESSLGPEGVLQGSRSPWVFDDQTLAAPLGLVLTPIDPLVKIRIEDLLTRAQYALDSAPPRYMEKLSAQVRTAFEKGDERAFRMMREALEHYLNISVLSIAAILAVEGTFDEDQQTAYHVTMEMNFPNAPARFLLIYDCLKRLKSVALQLPEHPSRFIELHQWAPSVLKDPDLKLLMHKVIENLRRQARTIGTLVQTAERLASDASASSGERLPQWMRGFRRAEDLIGFVKESPGLEFTLSPVSYKDEIPPMSGHEHRLRWPAPQEIGGELVLVGGELTDDGFDGWSVWFADSRRKLWVAAHELSHVRDRRLAATSGGYRSARADWARAPERRTLRSGIQTHPAYKRFKEHDVDMETIVHVAGALLSHRHTLDIGNMSEPYAITHEDVRALRAMDMLPAWMDPPALAGARGAIGTAYFDAVLGHLARTDTQGRAGAYAAGLLLHRHRFETAEQLARWAEKIDDAQDADPPARHAANRLETSA